MDLNSILRFYAAIFLSLNHFHLQPRYVCALFMLFAYGNFNFDANDSKSCMSVRQASWVH